MKNLIKKLVFRITYTKVPKKEYGRCISCAANDFCHRIIGACKCSDDEQYSIRIEELLK
jgi:hypothetical protein